MPAVIVGDDQVDRIGIVELVYLVLTIDHRDVPAEQVDEEALAVDEHGLEQRLVSSCQMAIDDMDHRGLPGLWLTHTKGAVMGRPK